MGIVVNMQKTPFTRLQDKKKLPWTLWYKEALRLAAKEARGFLG